MFDLGWSKLIVIAIIAIVVVGPKDLPPLLRALGKFIAQLRRQADEFRTHFNEAMRDTGYDEVKRDIAGIKAAATSTAHDISRQLDDSVKPLHDAAADIQRAGEADVAGAASVTGDPVSAYVNGHGAGVTDMPAMPPLVLPGSGGVGPGHGFDGLVSDAKLSDAPVSDGERGADHTPATPTPPAPMTYPIPAPAVAAPIPHKADA